MIGVGLIGAGFFGEMHARALAELPGARLVAASRRSSAALDEFCARFAVRGYRDYLDLINAPDVDAVVIAAPHYLHAEMAVQAARAGKHILLEKPMALSLDECDRILSAVTKAGVKIMVGHLNHFARAYQIAKRLLDSGEMGEVVLGTSTMSKFWFAPNRRQWHLDRTTGGGMWLTAGMHCLDRLTWLVGSPAVSVCGQFGTRFHDQEADDVGTVLVRYENGAVGSIVSTGYRIGAPKHLTEITCTKGMLNIEYTAGVTVGRDEKWQSIPESGASDWMPEALRNEWEAFLRALELDEEPAVSGSYARHIMAAVFAAEQSSLLRKEVAVEEASREFTDCLAQ